MEITPKLAHRKCSVVPGRSFVDLKALSLSLEADTSNSDASDYFSPSLMALRSSAPDRNIIGFAQFDITPSMQGYLSVRNGDAMLIIDERDDYYVAKPIGKLGIPGKISKVNVKLQPTTPAWDEFPTSPLTPLVSPTGTMFPTKSSRKNSSMASLKSSSSSKFGTLRRGSLQQKPLYATLGLFGIETNPFEPIPDVFGQVTAVQLIMVDRTEYVELRIDTQDTADNHIFRRLQDLASLHAQIDYEFTHELNRTAIYTLPPLPIPSTDTDTYLIDIDCFIADLVFLSGEIPIQTYLEDFFQSTQNDTGLCQLCQQQSAFYSAPRIKSLVLLDPIEPVPPLSPDFVQNSNLYSEPESILTNHSDSDSQAPSIPQLTKLKIKLEYETNLFAFFLTNDISYTNLQSQILNRIGLPPSAVHLRDYITKRVGLLTPELFTSVLKGFPSVLYLIASAPRIE